MLVLSHNIWPKTIYSNYEKVNDLIDSNLCKELRD